MNTAIAKPLTAKTVERKAEHLASLEADMNASKDKYVYYLLAITAGAVAFVAHETNQVALHEAHWILGVAVGFWLVSFYVGCKNRFLDISYLSDSFWSIGLKLGIAAERHSLGGKITEDQRKGLWIAEEFVDGIDEDKKNASVGARDCFEWQFRLFVLGAVAYIVWHIYEMYLRMPLPPVHSMK